MNDQLQKKSVNIFDLFILSVTIISLIALVLLFFNSFNTSLCIILSAIILLSIYKFFGLEIIKQDKRFNIYLLLILLSALIFRFPGYLYLSGGQDQGVYVNMAVHYQEEGSNFIDDDIRKQLKTPDALSAYDDLNQRNLNAIGEKYVENKMEGWNLPGIYIDDLSESKYVFQFYPMHPLWMAITGAIIGNNNITYSLLLFSILSIVGLYLCANEFYGKKTFIPGLIIAILLAFNPLHAFFSKFPVTELVALAFSSLGYYYLAKFYRKSLEKKYLLFELALSVGLFTAMFFTRISGFMYMPLFYLMALLTVLYCQDKQQKNYLLIYFFSILIAFIASNLYGYFYTFPYFKDIYGFSFQELFGTNWTLFLSLILFSLLVVLWICSYWQKTITEKIENIKSYFFKLFPFLLYGIILLAAYKAYLLGFTEHYINTYLEGRWHMVNTGIESFKFSNLFVAISYLSPLSFVLFLLAFRKYSKKNNLAIHALMVFLLCFWFYVLVMSFVTPYQYYYARYLLSELLPYSLLLLSFFLADYYLSAKKLKKYFAGISILIISIYSLYFTIPQINHNTDDGVADTLEQIAQYIHEDDLILAASSISPTIDTPLRYFYGINLVESPYLEKREEFENYMNLFKVAGEIFYLTNIMETGKNFQLIDSIYYKKGRFEHINFIPIKFEYVNKKNLYLYKYVNNEFRFFNIDIGEKSGFYSDGVWTNGAATVTKLNKEIMVDDRYLVLQTKGSNPYKGDLEKLGLKLQVNGLELRYSHTKDQLKYFFYLPEGISSIKEIMITSNTFIPSEMGINDDNRTLGIDFDALLISQ